MISPRPLLCNISGQMEENTRQKAGVILEPHKRVPLSPSTLLANADLKQIHHGGGGGGVRTDLSFLSQIYSNWRQADYEWIST